MKILIVRPWPSVLDVTKNTYNIQEVGLAKALVKRGHPTDILFWTDGDEMTVKVEVDILWFYIFWDSNTKKNR